VDTTLRVQQDVSRHYPNLRFWLEAEVQTEVSADILRHLSAQCGHPMSVEFFGKEDAGDQLFAVCLTPASPQTKTWRVMKSCRRKALTFGQKAC